MPGDMPFEEPFEAGAILASGLLACHARCPSACGHRFRSGHPFDHRPRSGGGMVFGALRP